MMPRICPGTICQVEINVVDLHQSLRFYRGVFGWEESPTEIHDTIIFQMPDITPFGVSLKKRGDTTFPPHQPIGIVPYFLAESLENIPELVMKHGGKCKGNIQKIKGYGSTFILEDPDGNNIGLFKPET